MPPNVNPGSFLASFTDTVNANGFQITTFQANGLISGENLFDPVGVTDFLTISFNTPINQLTVDFGLNTTIQAPGLLTLTASSGSTSQAASNVGGGALFPGGTLTFSTGTPFTSATLQGFQSNGTTPTQFSIDNLHLNPVVVAGVPEPTTMLAWGLVSALGVVATRLRMRAA